MNLSPLVVFVYNRPNHAKAVIESLAKNSLSKDTILYIFSDGAKNAQQKEKVEEVRNYIKTLSDKGWFAEVNIVCSDRNKGLAQSIISGVSSVIKKYGKVIVVEDDSKTSPDFLEFMNNALNFYEEKQKIWSIGGFSFIENLPSSYKYDVYAMGRTCSYAWATWKNRWDKVDWDVSDYKEFKYSLKRRKEFDRYGNDRSLMLDAQQMGRTNSWAIRFCYAMYKHHMFTIYPRYSRVKNIGQDGSGVHFKKEVKPPVFLTDEYIDTRHQIRCEDVELDEDIYKLFVKRFNMSPYNYMKKIFVNVKYLLFKK